MTADLADALRVTLVLATGDPEHFPRAAARWVGRLALEAPVSLAQLQLAAAAIAELVERPDHGCDLAALLEQLGLADIVAALDERGAASAKPAGSKLRGARRQRR